MASHLRAARRNHTSEIIPTIAPAEAGSRAVARPVVGRMGRTSTNVLTHGSEKGASHVMAALRSFAFLAAGGRTTKALQTDVSLVPAGYRDTGGPDAPDRRDA